MQGGRLRRTVARHAQQRVGAVGQLTVGKRRLLEMPDIGERRHLQPRLVGIDLTRAVRHSCVELGHDQVPW
ncbi:hypothetical protein D3C72_2233640 [compost metagenome]